MFNIKEILLDRIKSTEEIKAYENLKYYDEGKYKVEREDIINSILMNDMGNNFYKEEEMDISQGEIEMLVDYAQSLNSEHSDCNPGLFMEKNSYESSFAKKVYYNSELDFIVDLFLSHLNIHAFNDGNKRTALNMFFDLLYVYTDLHIENILIIQDAQILYLDKKIDEDSFKKVILSQLSEEKI